jgi:hypothetical protein
MADKNVRDRDIIGPPDLIIPESDNQKGSREVSELTPQEALELWASHMG